MPELAQHGHLGEPAQAQVTVGIGMLRAREHMGVAHVACAEGCTCEPRSFDLHSDVEVGRRPQQRQTLSLTAPACMHA